MQIGTLSRRTGISIRMLRYYEQEGLLTPKRQVSGYRDYGEDDEIAVRRIQMLSDAGLKLDAIRRILPCVIDEKPNFHPCNDLRALLRIERQKIDERIATMQSSREVLSRYLDDLD